MEENIDNILVRQGIKALIRIRCGNMEEYNKYELEEDRKVCVFCRIGKDNIKHYIEECEDVKGWFKEVIMNRNIRKYGMISLIR